MAIRKVILRDGREDTEAGWGKPQRRRVMSEGEAYVVTKILEDNIEYGTGVGAATSGMRRARPGRPTITRTRGSPGSRRTLTTSSGSAIRRAEIPMESVHGISVSGGSFPADIWRRYMSSAIGQLEPEEFPEPEDEPEWTDFERGQYARSFGSYDDGSDVTPTTETTETTAPAETAPAETVPDAPPASRPAPPPPPVTTAPPPPPLPTAPPPPPPSEPPPPTEPPPPPPPPTDPG